MSRETRAQRLTLYVQRALTALQVRDLDQVLSALQELRDQVGPHLPLVLPGDASLQEVQQEVLWHALRHTRSKLAAIAQLRVSRRTLYAWLKRWPLPENGEVV